MKRGLGLVAAALTMQGATFAAPVYKCTVNGKTAYSDAPCLGAKEVDVTPTQGMNKWTGTEKKPGTQIAQEITDTNRKAIEKGLGLPEGYIEKESRYSQLKPAEQRECRLLESQMAMLKAERPTNEQALYVARMRFFKLKC